MVALLTFLLVISWRVCGFGLLLVAVVLVNVAVVLVLSGLGGIVKRALGLVFMIWFCCFRCLFVRCFDELLCLCVC